MHPPIDPPSIEPLLWTVLVEPKEGPGDFIEKVLDHVTQKKAFTCLGAPGTGKTKGVLAKVRELLLEQGQNVVCLAPTHAAARLLPGKETRFITLLGSMLCRVLIKAGFCWMKFQCAVYLCSLRWINSDSAIAKSVLLEIGSNCLHIQIQTHGEDAMSHLGHFSKVASTKHGVTAPVSGSQDAEDLIKTILMFTLA